VFPLLTRVWPLLGGGTRLSNSGTHDGGDIPRGLPAVADIHCPEDAEAFLDVNFGVDKGWFAAIGRMSIFRISGFQLFFISIMNAVISNPAFTQQTQKEFNALFDREAGLIARALFDQAHAVWNDAIYGGGQITRAIKGDGMRFDKAVIAVLTLNKIAVDHGLKQWMIGPHQIVACAFYYANLHGRVLKLAHHHAGSDEQRFVCQ
jgi:hypothetical protein